jgi:hypothetical protein
MGRPAKNPEHPITRLRKALSTPTQEMTRALFSKRVRIPEATIKAIETGKFKLSDKNAAQIAKVTKVDPKCLMDPSLPLTDFVGITWGGQGKPAAAYFGEEFVDVRAVFETALEVAEEKRKQAVFSFLFQRWLKETCDILGLGPAITDKLQERYPIQCFAAIPKYLWPKDRTKRKDMEKRVKSFERKLTDEIFKVLSPPEETTPTLKEMDREEMAKLNPEEATTNPEAFLERWQKAQEVALERYFKILEERTWKEIQRFSESYADVARDLRKKKIEEANASLQQQAKHSRTR